MTKFLNISTDTTLGGSAPSDELAVSQKAIKAYVDSHSGGGSVAIDNSTITKNASDEIQAVAVIDQNTGIVNVWSGTGTEYEDVSEIDPDTVYITDDLGNAANVFRKEVSERNIGEIVYSSVPVTDSGLHLADGEVLDGTGIYKDFYDYMVAKSASAPEIFTTESDWQAEVATNGVCGKYVLDTGLVSIRIPKLKNKLLTDNSVIGNGMTLGVTKDNTTINTLIGSYGTWSSVSGTNLFVDNYNSQIGGAPSHTNAQGALGITTDPTKSGIEVASSVDFYCYVVIANTAKTPVQVDIDNIATELNACYGHRVVEFQEPTSANGYTWYRKYADGWVEQGAGLQTPTDALITVTMPVTMADTNYTLLLTRTWSGSNTNAANNGGLLTCNKTTTTFQCWGKYYDSIANNWQVSGMAA